MKAAEMNEIRQRFKEKMNAFELQSCMRCGFCLQSCPTYKQSGGRETSSPRGRVALMKAVADGMIQPGEDFERVINECLGCLACENACPSGVKYMELLEEARDIIAQTKRYSLPARVIRTFVFKGVFAKQKNMEKMMRFVRFYQRSGLRTLARKTRIMKLLPEGIVATEKVIPDVVSMKDVRSRPLHIRATGEIKASVAFFRGCLMDTMFFAENEKTIKLLQLAGCAIHIPKEQGCCAAIHGHSGEKEQARKLAKQNIAAFEALQADYIITNAGGCGAYLMEYDVLLKDDLEWKDRAKVFVGKIQDISKILYDLDFHKRVTLQLPEQIVTYQDSCHLRHVMKTFVEPRALIQSISGITYHEQNDATSCCGSAGIYSIMQNEISMAILDSKMQQIQATEATVIVTANPGCLLQMKVGIDREGLSSRLKAVHIVELLYEAVGLS